MSPLETPTGESALPGPAHHTVHGSAGSTVEPSGIVVALAMTLTIAALYFGRTVLMPITLAALLSFALSPPMLWLRRWHLGRAPSVIIVVTTAFIIVFGIGRMFIGQVSTLAANLPTYQQNLEDKVHSLRGNIGDTNSTISQAAGMLNRMSAELNGRSGPAGAAAQPALPMSAPAGKSGKAATPLMTVMPLQQPVPVEIRHPDPAPLQVLQSVVGPLLQPLATGALIILFVISFLFQRENLRDRFIRLVGSRDLQRTTQAMDDAGTRVSRYLSLQLLVNIVYAVPILIGLMLIGVPNALLWALLVVPLRFLPYLGVVIAAIFPLALSLAVDPGWNMLFWTAALFAGVEAVSGNLIEPWLYGSNTGLSSVAIIVAATFWTWLWGPIGLLLSTPLTVCLAVLGEHVVALRFLHVLLGNDAPLAPPETFYQRLLAADPDEAIDHAEAFVKDQSLTMFYDTVAIPALALGQADAERGALNHAQSQRIRAGMAEVIGWYTNAEPAEADKQQPQTYGNTALVLCIAGRNDLDDAASSMLAQLLEQEGIPTRTVTMEAVVPTAESTAYDVASMAGIRLICVSLLSTSSLARARMLIRKLRRGHLGDTKILVGFWGAELNLEARQERAEATGSDMVITSMMEAVVQIKTMVFPENSTLSELSRLVASAVGKQRTEDKDQ